MNWHTFHAVRGATATRMARSAPKPSSVPRRFYGCSSVIVGSQQDQVGCQRLLNGDRTVRLSYPASMFPQGTPLCRHVCGCKDIAKNAGIGTPAHTNVRIHPSILDRWAHTCAFIMRAWGEGLTF